MAEEKETKIEFIDKYTNFNIDTFKIGRTKLFNTDL